MRSIKDIANDVKTKVSTKFSTIRFSTAEASAQLINEINAMSAGKLPAVVIVIGGGDITDNARKQEISITLVLIDTFVAGSDDRALSVWENLQTLMDLFPQDASGINSVYYIPKRFYTASGDPKYACFAFEVSAVQV